MKARDLEAQIVDLEKEKEEILTNNQRLKDETIQHQMDNDGLTNQLREFKACQNALEKQLQQNRVHFD